MLLLRFLATCLSLQQLAAAATVAGGGGRKVMLWWALPGLGAEEPPTGHNQTQVDQTLAMLKRHRKGFTSIAFQYFSICGKYPGFGRHPADWVQCTKQQMFDPPHLAQAHPAGVPHDFGPQLKAALGEDVELWPVVNFGNGYPGDNGLSVQQMVNNTAAKNTFIADMIKGLHAQRATGVNFDWETGFTLGIINPFLTELADALHAATPPLKISYDCSSTPLSLNPRLVCHNQQLAPLDRWVSMQTYTGSLPGFVNALETGMNCSGPKFGVGLSAAAVPCNASTYTNGSFYQSRFELALDVKLIQRPLRIFHEGFSVKTETKWHLNDSKD
jgi:hypothetical protein